MTISVWLDDGTWQEPQDGQIEKFDLVIIGAGLNGLGMAYFANKKAPGLRILVLDAAKSGHGASGRNGGFVLRGIHAYYEACIAQYGRDKARDIYQFGVDNQILIREFIEDHDLDLEQVFCGSYLLASSLEEMDELARSAQLMSEDGFNVQLSPTDPLDRGFYGAMHNPDDFGINPYRFSQSLRTISSVPISENEAVRRIESLGSGDLKITTNRRHLVAERVYLATNAYSGLIEAFFVDKIKPARGQMIATAPLKKVYVSELCYANYGWEYFRQLPDRRLILGGCRQLFIEEETGFQDLITPGIQQALEAYLKDHFPELAGVAIEHRWSGAMAFTDDGLPMVGEMAECPHLYYAVGCNGHGLGYSMRLAQLACDMVFGDKPAALSIFDKEPASQGRRRLTVSDLEGP